MIIEHINTELISVYHLTKGMPCTIQVQGSRRQYGPWSFSLISLYAKMQIKFGEISIKFCLLKRSTFVVIFLILFYASYIYWRNIN